jgi:hypothetical protein
MTTQKSLMIALAVTAAASGCSKGSDTASVALDHPTTVRASGAQPQSQLTLYRVGVTDATRALSTVQIRDASLKVYAGGDRAVVEELTLKLADSDMAPTDTMPAGVRLRNQQLKLAGWLPATLTQREPDALAVQAHGSLQYSAELLNADGTLTPIGPVASDASDLDVHATRYEFGVKITVDTTPQGKCWNVPGVLEVGNCSLFVDMEGEAVNP